MVMVSVLALSCLAVNALYNYLGSVCSVSFLSEVKKVLMNHVGQVADLPKEV